MTLASGQTLSHYEIIGPLGAGGMGEVYRARDTRLEREVAIKVLPEEFARDEDRLRRFEREAKTLASLNHPNLAHIYGIDRAQDTCFIAMELVGGKDLAARLARGPLPVAEAIDVCRQIAEGLEAAHEAGVVHRDLKPANVQVTPDGRVKILDFGLAKPIVPKATPEGTSSATPDSFLLTEDGLVLGTPTYMSPEQARGKPVDRRTDIWAFGCVLYECLSGKQTFAGESLSDVIALILGGEPDWKTLPAATPRHVASLMQRCLDRDARQRLRDIGEARVQLALQANAPGLSRDHDGVGPPRSGRLRSIALTATVSLFSLIAGLWIGSDDPAGPSSETGSAKPSLHAILHEFEEDQSPERIAISPTGTRVAWAVRDGLYVRVLDDPEPRKILEKGIEWGEFAWSPDGLEIAFIDDQALWRIPADGGAPSRFADFEGSSWTTLMWLEDGRIAHEVEEGIVAVSEEGERTMVVEIDKSEILHLHGFLVLPDGESALAVPHLVGGGAHTIDFFRKGKRKEIVPSAAGEPTLMRVTPAGHLFWKEEGRGLIWKVSVSLEGIERLGEPQLVAEDCYSPSVSCDGRLAYLAREGKMSQVLGWIDRSDGDFTSLGRRHETDIWGGHISSDEGQIVYTTNEKNGSETWVHDVERRVSTVRIQRDDGTAISRFFPDGRIGVTPITTKEGTFVYPPSGKGEPETFDGPIWGVSSDGAVFITAGWTQPGESPYYASGPGVEGGKRVLLSGEYREIFHRLSEDGAWMIYSSLRTGVRQVFLSRFPPTAQEEWSVSAEGAEAAWFGEASDEIFFVHEGVLNRVAFDARPVVRLGSPEALFRLPANLELLDYDGSDRFLAKRTSWPGKSRLYVDTDWAE